MMHHGRTRFGFWMAVLLAGLAAAEFSGAASDPPVGDVARAPAQARRALFQARDLSAAGDDSSAAVVLAECLREHPDADHYLLRHHLGDALTTLGRPQEALPHCEAAVAGAPSFAQAWLGLGRAAWETENYERAGEAFLANCEHRPDDAPDILHFAAVGFMLAAMPARAAPILEDLVGGSHGRPELDWYRTLISCCLDLSDEARGRAAVKNMLDDHALDPEAWHLASQQALGSEDYRQAAVALTVADYLRPLDRAERLRLGDLYSALGVPALAEAHYTEAMSEEASAAEMEKLGSVRMASHELEKALEAFRRCTELDSDNGRAWLLAGWCALELGRDDEAIAALERASGFDDQASSARELLNYALESK